MAISSAHSFAPTSERVSSVWKGEDPSESIARRKGLSPKSTSDWERVAALFAVPGGGSSFVLNAMARLDAKALHKLAANVATWPRCRRNERILGKIFHRWGELDPQTALAQARTLFPSDLAFAATREVVDGYLETDPAGASAYLAAPPAAGANGFLRNNWSRSIRLGQALQNWAEQDAAAAVGFANDLPPDAYRPYILDYIAQEWMHQDPSAALNWAQSLGAHNQRASALSGIVTTWAQTDPAAAANYVLGLSGNPDQTDLVNTLATAWAGQDQAAAARWVLQQNGGIQAKAAAAVAGTWVELDPLATAAWSNQFPAGDTRNATWAAIAKGWYVNDPPAAVGWLNNLPVGDGRDAAIVGATEYWSLRGKPTETLDLVEGISDPQVRSSTLIGVLNGWLERDQPAAQQWIGQANLPDTVAGKLKGG